MVSKKVIVKNPRGIHVRPSGMIISAVRDYEGRVEVLSSSGKRASLRSILALLSLGLTGGEEITLEVSGPQEEKVCSELAEMFASHFDFELS